MSACLHMYCSLPLSCTQLWGVVAPPPPVYSCVFYAPSCSYRADFHLCIASSLVASCYSLCTLPDY